mmetsp:Transcript_119752/g.344121  ORF Transcript_119752/g.344121 Transcript_119752/m.344121 type:complete len:214 (+) Transcript_119752:577-1218(+)
MRRRDAGQCAINHAVCNIAYFSELGLTGVARAICTSAAWARLVACACGNRDALPTHELAEFLVAHEQHVRHFDAFQHSAGLVDQRRLHLAHPRASNLRNQCRIFPLLHGVDQRLLLRQTRNLLLLRLSHGHMHLRMAPRADGRIDDDSVTGGVHAAPRFQRAEGVGNDATLPNLVGHEVDQFRATAAKGACGGKGIRTGRRAGLHLHTERYRW